MIDFQRINSPPPGKKEKKNNYEGKASFTLMHMYQTFGIGWDN